MTDEPAAARLREALRGVVDPATGRDIVAAGMLEGLEVRDGLVQATLAVDRSRAAEMEGSGVPRRRCSRANPVCAMRPSC